jgi:DNA topoisomerase-1
VIGLLEQHFSRLVDYGFTASMEEDLDDIASGSAEAEPWLDRFYFGVPAGPANGGAADNGHLASESMGLKAMVSENLGEIDAREINSITIGDDLVVRVGRYGPYLQRGEDRVSIPDDMAPDELTVERATELLSAGSTDRSVGVDPNTGLPVVVRAGRFGPYVQLGQSDEVEGKPLTASLFRTMDPLTISLEDALKLLKLPRVIGADPADGSEIIATNGRYGPYIKKGSDSRSLGNEDALFSITLDQALAIFAEPKQRRGQRSAEPLRELGADPVSGANIILREGRFGPYVTDGTTNASLRKGDSIETLTPERAHELLADRRAAGPAVKRSARVTKATGTAKRTAGTPKKTAATAKKAAGPAKRVAGTAKKAAGPAKRVAGTTKKTAGTTKKTAGTAKKAAGTAKKAAGTTKRTTAAATKSAGSAIKATKSAAEPR